MRILITGGAGLLGRTLATHAPSDWSVAVTERHTPARHAESYPTELSNPDAVASVIGRVRPDLIVHTAYGREDFERDIWSATVNVVDAARGAGIGLMHMSTDMVFDGENAPYAEADEPRPVHAYGEWKARAEAYVREQLPAAVVVRASLLTSFDPLDPRSEWVARGLDGSSEPPRLHVDEIRCPIAVEDCARQMWEIAGLAEGERAGVWHLAGPEALSRYSLGVLIAARQGLSPAAIVPASVRDSPEPRPRDLRLLTRRADERLRTRARGMSELATQTATMMGTLNG